ncbi:MFS transporter [Dyadobacter sp. CY261]|uniref:MFS transporter n=1 Tax=Dyadobacter sp. CY261 TaxID=2907203 RepID=UPI001F28A359|nr:MFS transporter [Dyadobacter sp. CY261]MCF0073012.1 MFS transporter [Dyadobacter sp. CY261]
MKKIFPLVSAQALYQTAAVLVAALSGLVGFNLAKDKSLATLPVALISVGTAAILIPASVFMKKYGRKRGFMVGVALGFVAGGLTAAGIYYTNFWLFVVGNMFIGAYGGFAQYYRFAAAESVAAEDRSKAISWVVSGGVFAAIAGPLLARLTKDIGHLPFFYSYLSVSVLSIIAIGIISAVKEAGQQEDNNGEVSHKERPLSIIAKQPVFIAALISSAVGFAVMVMVMTATPIAMKLCGHDADDSSIVIQWHVLGMFVPSFFTGNLVQKFGAVRIISLGILIFLTHVAFALTGTDFFHFVSGLIFLGVGWNFMFIGGTALLTRAYTPADRAKTQSFHDFAVYAVTTLSSFLAGAVLNLWGWEMVNMVAVPFLVVALVTIQWFGRVAQT